VFLAQKITIYAWRCILHKLLHKNFKFVQTKAFFIENAQY